MSLHWQLMIEMLKEDHRIKFDDGLTGKELRTIENRFHFRFPPDLSEFLQIGLPVGDRFPDWRNGSDDDIRSFLHIPLEGILFDVKQNGFWLPEWGTRPESYAEAEEIVRKLIEAAPTLIPVWGHRMIPDRPHEAGNPVFSVHQTDIIYYGCDLRDYFLHEFICKSELGIWPIPVESVRKIEFWDPVRFWTRWASGPMTFDNTNELLP